MSSRRRHGSKNAYRQNDGKPGVVYILANAAFTENLHKIGQSKHSGAKRARDLNADATTGTPALFHCVFELETLDCFQAEQRVHRALSQHRVGKRGQEYFKVSLEQARATIEQVCVEVDREYTLRPSPQALTAAPASNPQPYAPLPQRSNPIPVAPPAQREQSATTHSRNFSRPSGGLAGRLVFWAAIIIIGAPIITSMSSTKRRPSNVPTPRTAMVSNPVASVPELPVVTLQMPHATDQGGEQQALKDLEAYAHVTPISTGSEPTVPTVGPPAATGGQTDDSSVDGKTAESRRAANRVGSPPELPPDERRALDAACAHAKYSAGTVAYNQCLNHQLAQFGPANRPSGLDRLNFDERRSLEAACTHAKYSAGPAAYNECLNQQLARFDPAKRPSGLDGLNVDERRSLEAACTHAKYGAGPAEYNECLNQQLARFDPAKRPSDLDRLNVDERRSLEAACTHAKYGAGPAAYNECLNQQLAQFNPSLRPYGLDRLNRDERRSLEAACSHEKFSVGPSAYIACQKRQLEQLKLSQHPNAWP